MTQPPGFIRMAYVDITNTGREAALNTNEGSFRLERVDPYGVQMIVGGKSYGLTKEALPYVGRFFLAAAVMLGVDINEGWDKPIQEGGAHVHG